LDVELAKAKVAAENAGDIKAAEIRAAQAEKQNSITDSLAIKREPLVVLKRDGFFSNKYLVAIREDQQAIPPRARKTSPTPKLT